MRKRVLALSLTIVATVLGFLIAVQINTQKNVTAAEDIQAQRLASVKTLLTDAQAESTRLKEENKTLTAQLDQARKQGGTSPEILAELDSVRMMEGTQAVQGPGIQITIDDRSQDHKTVFPLTTDDLMTIINTLKFAGAEEISLNGQRIVASSSLVLSGTATKLVNQVPISKPEGVPYEILAIGPQDTLVDYFTKLEASALKSSGVNVSVVRKTVQIPSYKGSFSIPKTLSQ